MLLPLSVIDTIASVIMLGVGIGIIVILVMVERRVKRSRKTMYPYVILFRSTGDAVPLGTYGLREHAMKALEIAVRTEGGIPLDAEMPATVLERFNDEHTSWRGKNIMGNNIHIWLAKVKET